MTGGTAAQALLDINVDETVGSPGKPRRIYAYTVIGKDSEPWTRTAGTLQIAGRGLIKVGETARPNALERIKQQLGTAYPDLQGITIFFDEPATAATERTSVTMTFTGCCKRSEFAASAANGSRPRSMRWRPRSSRSARASGSTPRARTTSPCARSRKRPSHLPPATSSQRRPTTPTERRSSCGTPKMRFGKTFTTYQLAREMGWTRVLVLTYKPAVQISWRDDLLSHVDFEGWHFVDRDTPSDITAALADGIDPLVWFASFQDLGGKTAEGEIKAHNETIHLID